MHLLTIKSARVGERGMLIGRHSFIRQSKLSDVAGRIDYISNPKRQEHLYATYQTEGATPEFWKNLARENQLDFKARGTAGKCIEGREFIIALPESFVQYRADDVVRLLRKLSIKDMAWSAAQPFITTRQRRIIIFIWYSVNGKCWSSPK